MWPFSNRGPRLDVEEALLKHQFDIDFSIFVQNDVYIKLWMPEKIITSIDVLSLRNKVSRPDILRWVFFEHAYGRERFACLCAYAELLKAARLDSVPVFSRKQVDTVRSVNQRFLGKATEDVKLWLPNQLKIDLQKLADASDEGLSDYLRSVLVRHLFGEHFYESLQEALATINQNAVEHENSDRSEDELVFQPKEPFKII